MADPEQNKIFETGKAAWNEWRIANPDVAEPDLSQKAPHFAPCETLLMSSSPKIGLQGSSNIDLSGIDFSRTNLSRSVLYFSDLRRSNFCAAEISSSTFDNCNLSFCNLNGANFRNSNLHKSKFIDSDLSGSILAGCDLTDADLSGADLRYADLRGAKLVRTNLGGANLTGCKAYGAAVWGLNQEGAIQRGISITDERGPQITVDDIEIGQFLYLMINNAQLRRVIDGITSKIVLILGRFTPERKLLLDNIRDRMFELGYIAVVFDFENPKNICADETVSLIARMARFIIADITDAKSVLQEMRTIVPDLPSVPIQPILLFSQEEPGMFDFFKRFPWVLATAIYTSPEDLLLNIDDKLIKPAEAIITSARGG